jgi:hypothetical protein
MEMGFAGRRHAEKLAGRAVEPQAASTPRHVGPDSSVIASRRLRTRHLTRQQREATIIVTAE